MKKQTEEKILEIMRIGSLILTIFLIVILLYKIFNGAYSGSRGVYPLVFMMIIVLALMVPTFWGLFRRKKK